MIRNHKDRAIKEDNDRLAVRIFYINLAVWLGFMIAGYTLAALITSSISVVGYLYVTRSDK